MDSPPNRSARLAAGSGKSDERMILVTGACGHIGREVCRFLRDARRSILPIDVEQDETARVLACDLRSEVDIAQVFQGHQIHTVVLRHNSMRTENSAIPWRDAGPSTLSLHPPSAKILSRGTPAPCTCIYKGWGNPDVFATLRWFGLGGLIVPVVQPSQSHMRKDAT